MNKKEKFQGFLLVVVFVFVLALCGRVENNYSIKATVKDVNNGIVLFEDEAGYLWEVDRPEERVSKGDEVKIKFFNNCTDNEREDDEILSFKIINRKID